MWKNWNMYCGVLFLENMTRVLLIYLNLRMKFDFEQTEFQYFWHQRSLPLFSKPRVTIGQGKGNNDALRDLTLIRPASAKRSSSSLQIPNMFDMKQFVK